GEIHQAAEVRDILPEPGGGIRLKTAEGPVSAARVILAAGLGSVALAARLGIEVPLRPEKGQILVTGRLAPFLPRPSPGLRQTPEGTVLIGATNEDAGFDTRVTRAGLQSVAARALAICPPLAEVPVVRSWAALRIMTPDGYPLYQ